MPSAKGFRAHPTTRGITANARSPNAKKPPVTQRGRSRSGLTRMPAPGVAVPFMGSPRRRDSRFRPIEPAARPIFFHRRIEMAKAWAQAQDPARAMRSRGGAMATDRAPKGLDRFQLAGAYVGSVLGAGFASGQEHAAFFLKFGAEGFLALGVAGLMFAVFGAWLLALAHRYQTCSHTHLLEVIAPQPLATLFDALLSFFAFA